MKLHLLKPSDSLNLVRGYATDRITVGEDIYSSSFILAPNRIISDWKPTEAAELDEADFALLLDLEPEVVLLGTGNSIRFPPHSITRPLSSKTIGLEVMTTAAACRTYNILAGEGRLVVAALIIEKTPIIKK